MRLPTNIFEIADFLTFERKIQVIILTFLNFENMGVILWVPNNFKLNVKFL